MKKIHHLTQAVIPFLIIGVMILTTSVTYAEPIHKDQDFFDAIKEYIDDNYALTVTDDQLYDGAVKGMFDALDPYSEYLTATEYAAFKEMTSGKYTGVGAVMGKDEAGFHVISVFAGSPAEQGGLKPGDRILSVGGKTPDPGISLQQMVGEIKGMEGTTVTLVIGRGETQQTLTLTRRPITVRSVEYRSLDKAIGYLKINEFQENTYQEVTTAIVDLKQKNVSKLVLDLRGNPGGLLTEVIAVAGYFVPKGKLVEVRYKTGQPDVYYSLGNLQFDKIVVLVDGNTASAAEILAGAIKDTKAGILIGQKTYGKGVVQDIYELRNGEAIKLTIAKYYLPGGSYIQDRGIMPHQTLSPTPKSDQSSKDLPLEKALELLRG